MSALMIRNLRIYFRDRTSVFFSLLGVIMIIGLYALFLGDMMMNGVQNVPGARFLMDSWIMAGLVAVASVTTSLGAYGVLVEDRSMLRYKDFAASPVSRSTLVGGYMLNALVVGTVMSVIALLLAEGYILIGGGALLPLGSLLEMLGCILLSVLASTAMIAFVTSFLKTQGSYAAASTIVGTLIGFLTGIYIPIGSLPEAVQFVVKIFPVSHAASLMRQAMMRAPMDVSFVGAPTEAVDAFRRDLGVEFVFGANAVTPLMSVMVLIGTALLFYALAIWRLSKKVKN